MVMGELTRPEAEKVFRLYKKNRLLSTKHAAHGGNYEVKHGAYLDREVLKRAAAYNE
jgi:hypothetical protein